MKSLSNHFKSPTKRMVGKIKELTNTNPQKNINLEKQTEQENKFA
jgi:hypothetical protein